MDSAEVRKVLFFNVSPPSIVSQELFIVTETPHIASLIFYTDECLFT